MNDITWLRAKEQERFGLKINHSHKFETCGCFLGGDILIPKVARSSGSGLMILLIVESSGKINKEAMHRNFRAAVPPAPHEFIESTSERETSSDYRIIWEECAKNDRGKLQSFAGLLSGGVH